MPDALIDEIAKLEQRRDQLQAECDAQTRHNQRRRGEILLALQPDRRQKPMILAIAISFMLALIVAQRWFPGTRQTTVICR